MSDNNKPKKKWYKRWWAFVLYFFIFIIIIAGSSDSEQADTNQVSNSESTAQEEISSDADTPEVVNQEPVTTTEIDKQPAPVQEAPKLQEKTYQEVFTFTGTGAKKSEPFTITGSRFKIKYDCNGDLCQAFLHNTKSQFDMDLIMNNTGSISDETILYGSGEYYIEANTIGNYTMIVEDYR